MTQDNRACFFGVIPLMVMTFGWLCAPFAAQAMEVQVTTRGGLQVASMDGRFGFELGGRLMTDYAHFFEDGVELGSGTELRRARIETEGDVSPRWGFELGVELGGGAAELKDAYLAYSGWDGIRLRVGQQKEPFSLEEQTSSKYITFMERALPNAFAPDRHIGIGLGGGTDRTRIAAGLYGDAYDDDPAAEGDEGWGAALRLTHAPVSATGRTVHVGASASYRQPDSAGKVRFRARPESHLTDVRYANTGKIANTRRVLSYGAEAAWVHGPVSVQGEYMLARVTRRGGLDTLRFDGYYLYASWFLTGESRRYKEAKGAFGKVKPRLPSGAWELALRYSALDLTDADVQGGEAGGVTVGVNWYASPVIRLMANVVFVDNNRAANDDGSIAGGDDPVIFQTRFQVAF